MNLIIGKGEVGEAIQKVIGGEFHDPYKNVLYKGTCEVMHVCFPYFEGFLQAVQEYKDIFKPNLIIIHSSVPIGTSDIVGAVHSPIRGVHPFLEDGVRTFIKYFGGKQAKEASEIFEKQGVKVQCYEDARLTEAGKLWDTTQYGVFIDLNKEIYRFCQENDLDFDVVYTHFNETYNDGYLQLGKSNVVRPILKYMEGSIGGHCVLQNSKLLNSESPKKLREKYAI